MKKPVKYNFLALGLCVAACCGWMYVLHSQYERLAYYSWDLALYAQVMWDLCHGSATTSLFSGNFLIDHFNTIAFLLVPFYFFFQSALTLLYFKLFAFFAGAYVFYLLANKRVGGSWAVALMLAYIFYPANVTMLFFEFNFENLALPLIFLIFYFFEEKKYAGFMVSCFLLTLVKENMPLVVFMFGLYGFLIRKEGRINWGVYPMILGASMFVWEVFVLIPWLRQSAGTSHQAYWALYSRLGASPREIFQTLIFNEPKVFILLFSSHNALFLLELFGPLLIVAVLAPQILLLAAPLFLQHMLSGFHGQQSIDFFYSSTLTVFIFMAALEAVNRLHVKIKPYILCMVVALLLVFDLGYFPRWQERIVPAKESQDVTQYFLSQIPADAKVLSSYKFLYLLSQRKDLYVLFRQRNPFSYQKINVPDAVDYIAVDFSGRIDSRASFKRLLSQGPWKVENAADEVVLLRKNMASGEPLIRVAQGQGFLSKPSNLLTIGNDVLRLEGLQVPQALKYGQRIMPVVFYWKAIKSDKNRGLPAVSLNISHQGVNLYANDRRPFYGLPLQEGEYCMETFYYLIPQLERGDYQVVVYSRSVGRREQTQAVPLVFSVL